MKMKTLQAAALTVLLATGAVGQDLAPKPEPDPGKTETPRPPIEPTPIVQEVVGPVVGHVEEEVATLWLRAPFVRAVTVSVDGGPARSVSVKSLGRGYGTVRVDGLAADAVCKLTVQVPGAKEPTTLTFRTAPPPVAYGRVRFGAGSCARFVEQPVWKQVEAAAPDLFLWLGDNCYYWSRTTGGNDFDSVPWMLEKQMWERTKPGLLRAMQRMACYATWDDHDFGPNNSDSHFPLRFESRLVHRTMWANPGCGQDDEGIYFSFRRGPVEFFVVDARFFKDVRRELPRTERVLYGERQLAWLRQGLDASSAPLKVVAGGVQQLLGYPYAEGWDQAPTERRRFLDWLTINGSRVLFLSGDIHVSELYRVSIGKDAFAWELTASALANGTIYADAFRLLRRNQRKWIVTDPNFCVVEIDIPKDDPTAGTVKFTSILASTGKIGAQSETTLATFGSTKRRRSFK